MPLTKDSAWNICQRIGLLVFYVVLNSLVILIAMLFVIAFATIALFLLLLVAPSSRLPDILEQAFPFDAIMLAGCSAWWLLPRMVKAQWRHPEIAKLVCPPMSRILRPITLCIVIANIPHTIFLLLWPLVSSNERGHSWLGWMLLEYEGAVLHLHERLEPYERLGWLTWAAIVLVVGLVGAELAQPWLLKGFLKLDKYVSRLTFIVAVAVAFTVTTAVPGMAWDPDVRRRLDYQLRAQWEAEALREVADAVAHRAELDPQKLDAARTVPPITYKWSDRDLETPEERQQRQVLEKELQGNPAKGRILREVVPRPPHLSEEDRRAVTLDVAHNVAQTRARNLLSKQMLNAAIMANPPMPRDMVSVFQRVRDQTDVLRARAEAARTAATEAFVHAAGIDTADIDIVRAIFKEMLQATAEEIAKETIERVPADLILAKTANMSAIMETALDAQTWSNLTAGIFGSTQVDPRPTEELRAAVADRIRETARSQEWEREQQRVEVEKMIREVK
jgi:hypothetical protein